MPNNGIKQRKFKYVGFFFIWEAKNRKAPAKAVKESNTARRAVQGVEKTQYLRHSLTIARAIRKGTELPARAVGRSASWTLGKSQAFGRYALRNSKTVSKLVSVRPALRRGLPDGLPNPKGQRYYELSAKYFRDADLGGRSADEITNAGRLMDQNSPTEVSLTLRRMDDSEQAAFLDSVAEVNSKVDDLDAEAFARKYNKLEEDNEQQFRELAKNDEYGESWTRTVSSDEINKDDIEVALTRVGNVGNEGHDVSDFRTAKEANSMSDHEGNQDPHMPGSIVVEFEIDSQDRFVRLHNADRGPAGRWMMRPSEFNSFDSKEEVLDHFALSKNWQDYNSVAEIEMDGSEDLTVQVSTAGPVEDTAADVTRPGGQHSIIYLSHREHPGGMNINHWKNS